LTNTTNDPMNSHVPSAIPSYRPNVVSSTVNLDQVASQYEEVNSTDDVNEN